MSVASSLHARFQELDLSTQCLMGQDSSREEPWTDTVELTLRKLGNYQKVCEWGGGGGRGRGLFLPATVWVYVVYLPWQLCSVRMVGVFLLVYIRQDLFQFVSDVETETVQTGMLGLMVSVSMQDGVDV